MTMVFWHLRLTLDSSTKQLVQDAAKAERRTIANHIAYILEKHVEKEKPDDPR